ncbi:MAG: sugar ABC transporter permease [Candidatus Margulisiibacteriota bacterium]|nr:MAG: sugar ABC transporter permease [Candidatus Margulisiibacteriota bacterium]HAR64544.1 sugar ABC transporter permease [Candidatus Margulisiibacteriota bacterium]HCT84583.1 sugar ABC transporter permease [Candidatus Margulisiibacteriota bacterium]HCY37098.1 sugar ABC transporter permease [Candidatus Margulisiibacteriota bacterium]
MDRYLSAPFVNWGNYYDVLFNPNSPVRIGLGQAVRNTLYYSVFVTIGQLGMGLIVALMLNRDFRGRSVIRTLFLFPWIVPTFVTGLLWGFMWQQDIGIINYLLYDIPLVKALFFNVFHIHDIINIINAIITLLINVLLFPISYTLGLVGVEFKYAVENIFPLLPAFTSEIKPAWLTGPNTFWAIVVPTIWRFWPLSMLMLLAGLQNIPDSLYEAASIDGASSWKKFWHITVPMLKSVWAILLMFGIIYNVYSFNIVIMMFGNGAGFPGEWGDLMMTNIFRNSFQQWNFGNGAAISIMFMAFMSIVIYYWHKFYISSEEIYR